jgi:hypothetical protein
MSKQGGPVRSGHGREGRMTSKKQMVPPVKRMTARPTKYGPAKPVILSPQRSTVLKHANTQRAAVEGILVVLVVAVAAKAVLCALSSGRQNGHESVRSVLPTPPSCHQLLSPLRVQDCCGTVGNNVWSSGVLVRENIHKFGARGL